MTTERFQEILKSDFNRFLQVSNEISDEVSKMSQLVQKAFLAQYEFLKNVDVYGERKVMEFLKPTSDVIETIQEFRNKYRKSPFFNHLSSISEGIAALGWVTVKPTPAPFIKEMIDASQFYTNKILIEWKNKDPKHLEWVNSWIETLKKLHLFVKQYHTTGLKINSISATSPPPPPPLLPNCFSDFGQSNVNQLDNDRSALFAEINQGENITKHLKKVQHDSPTNKNVPMNKDTKVTSPSKTKEMTGIKKSPICVKDGKKWKIENYIGDNNMVISNTEMNNIVYIFNCMNCTIMVKGKVNSITLDSCKKTAIVFDSVVASTEFINCQSVKMQVLEFVPTILIDKTDGCQIYLNEQSLKVEIVTAKSTEMNVCLPMKDDYIEYPIAEQFKTTITPDKTLSTTMVEKKG